MIKSYVINLKRSAERLEAIGKKFESINIPFERLEAVDGKLLTDTEFQELTEFRQGGGKPMSRGQIGCFLSHFHAWEIAANSPDPYTAIFEDDMHISPDLRDFLITNSWIPKECEIIRLEPSTNRVLLSKNSITEYAGRSLRKVQSTTWCAGGYIISKDTARKLIELPKSTHDSVDYFLFCLEQSSVARGLHISQIYPALCVQDKFFYKDVRDIRFYSNINDIDPELSLRGRMKYLKSKPILSFFLRTLQGYKKIPYQA